MIRGLESLSDSIRMFILEHRFYFQENKKKHKKYLSQLLIENTDESLPIRNVDDWLDKFNRLTYAYPDLIEVGEAFCQSHINIIQDRKVLQNDVLAICVEKK